MKTVFRGLILVIGMVVYSGAVQAQQYAAYVMDARTGKVVHSRNADTRLHPASLTKMMTLYIVFDEIRRGRLSLDQKIRISKNAASEPPSKLGLRAGQQIELRYLIRAAAVKSANDAATALGEAVAGSEAAFAQRMTAYAKGMGMSKTTFRNANGLTQEGHLSTAHDMALLGRRMVYDFPQYYNLFSRRSTSAGIKTVKNTNRRLLDAYPGADGIKTGYTRAAGFNLVSSATKGDKRVIVAVFGGKSTASRNAEVARLMDLGFSKMPRYAQVQPPAALRTTAAVASAATQEVAPTIKSTRGSTAGLAASRVAALSRSARPLPRSTGMKMVVARNQESISAAIAELNEELVASQVSASAMSLGKLIGRPAPRPGAANAAETPRVSSTQQPATNPGSASLFAATAPTAPMPRAETVIPVTLTASNTTGANGDWGVQIGSYRAKGDAERQLLTTALKDVPQLSGGLRRIDAAKVSGVTVYRAQFIGLNQENALSACAVLVQMQSDCLPLAPGT